MTGTTGRGKSQQPKKDMDALEQYKKAEDLEIQKSKINKAM